MRIRRKKVDVQIERQILIGMIVSTEFLRNIEPVFRTELLEVQYSTLVSRWCFFYFKKYEKAPNRDIQSLYERWSRKNRDSDQLEYIEEFLSSLSDEFEHADKFNSEYIYDKAITYFKARSLKILTEEINENLDKEDVEGAELSLVEFRKIEKVQSTAVDPFDDLPTIQAAFEAREEPLFKVPGALGKMMNPDLVRNGLVGLMGPEKRGKTWWLQYLGKMAHRNRCNVAYFSVGDMTKDQLVRREHISLAGRSDQKKYCGEILVPVLDCVHNQKDSCEERYRTCSYGVYEEGKKVSFYDAPHKYKACSVCAKENPRQFKGAVWHEVRKPVEPLTWREAYKLGQEYKKKIRAKGYKLDSFPNDTMNVAGIVAILNQWEQVEGFVADVVIVDYADILAPEDSRMVDSRSIENKKWKALRRLSQEYHCLVLTATQADAASYYAEKITRSNFSEDKRKFAHATAVYALNQTIEEKRSGIMRLGPLVIREDAYDEAYNVTVLQCLEMGKAYLASF